MDDWFTLERIDEDTDILSEYRHWEETHCYLLRGRERSLLIDTGLGLSLIHIFRQSGPHHPDRRDRRDLLDTEKGIAPHWVRLTPLREDKGGSWEWKSPGRSCGPGSAISQD